MSFLRLSLFSKFMRERAAVPLGQTMASSSVLLQEKAESSLPMAIE